MNQRIINTKVLKCKIAYNMQGGFCIPLSSIHRPACQLILDGKVHEPDTIDYIKNNCSNGDIIHAGTYFGDFLPELSRSFVNGSKIWAFEPSIENYQCTEITIILNKINNVELINSALGENTQIEKLMIQDEKRINLGGSSRIIKKNEKNIGLTIDIKIVAIDDVIPIDRMISIIHLDVEGYEEKVLKGAMKTIKRCNPILILEDNNKIISNSWFNRNINALGYKIVGKVHNNTILNNG